MASAKKYVFQLVALSTFVHDFHNEQSNKIIEVAVKSTSHPFPTSHVLVDQLEPYFLSFFPMGCARPVQ